VSKDAKKKRQNKKKIESKEARSMEEKEKEAPGKRRKIPCPLLACKARVVHLPHHMRNVHKWTKEAASKVLLKYNIRQRKSHEDGDGDDDTEQSRKKDYHRRRRCPIPACHTIVFRLATHLQKVHKFQRSSKAYKDSLACATIVPDTKHHLLRYKEERKTNVLMGQSFGDDTSSGSTSDGHDEDDSDEDDSDDDQVVTGAAEKPAPHPVIARFEEWLESPDGGRRKKRQEDCEAAQFPAVEDIDSDRRFRRHQFSS
jgi:hypothetical protein